MKDFLSLRVLTKFLTMLAGLVLFLIIIIWTRASLAWGTDTSLQWAWFVIAIVAGVSSIAASLKTVSTRSMLILIGVDALLGIVIWWL